MLLSIYLPQLQQGGPPAYENVQYRPPADTVVELYDDLSRMRCIEIPRHTLRYPMIMYALICFKYIACMGHTDICVA